MLRVRQGLTLNKVLRPLLSKYNIDADQIAVCFAGTCDPVPLGTTVANIQPRTVIVMAQQQFHDRKLLSKREYQKELNAAANLLSSDPDQTMPFHQHGDIAFYEVPLENEGRGLKLNATRSHSTNPRVSRLILLRIKIFRNSSSLAEKQVRPKGTAGITSPPRPFNPPKSRLKRREVFGESPLVLKDDPVL